VRDNLTMISVSASCI